MLGAVSWDLDGTLVDSEQYHWRAWKETLDRERVSFTYQDLLASFGQRNDTILSNWLGTAVSAADIQRIGDAQEERNRALVRQEGLAPLPGAAEWIERLHSQGWRQAIASSAPRANVETILNALRLRSWFQANVSAEDVHAGKPDPQVFLVAASRVGAESRECIVVEDARAGIEAAPGDRECVVSASDGTRIPWVLTWPSRSSDLPARCLVFHAGEGRQ
jgi:HAD superfamily hydrolase (TIGR01509 family)